MRMSHYSEQREEELTNDRNPVLLLGDCLERMKEIPDGSVDMILTDHLMAQPLVSGIQLFHLNQCGSS